MYPKDFFFKPVLRNSKFLIGVTPKVAGGGGSDGSRRFGRERRTFAENH